MPWAAVGELKIEFRVAYDDTKKRGAGARIGVVAEGLERTGVAQTSKGHMA